jgi:GTP1/Obg family GTP-binding protein
MTLPAPFDSYVHKIKAANDAASLDAIAQDLYGRKAGVMTLAMKELGALSPEDRRAKGVGP